MSRNGRDLRPGKLSCMCYDKSVLFLIVNGFTSYQICIDVAGLSMSLLKCSNQFYEAHKCGLRLRKMYRWEWLCRPHRGRRQQSFCPCSTQPWAEGWPWQPEFGSCSNDSEVAEPYSRRRRSLDGRQGAEAVGRWSRHAAPVRSGGSGRTWVWSMTIDSA